MQPDHIKRIAVLVALYLGVLAAGAAYCVWFDADYSSTSIWTSLVAAFPLGYFGLFGSEVRDDRMSYELWFLIPKVELLPVLLCWGIGLLLFKLFTTALQGEAPS